VLRPEHAGPVCPLEHRGARRELRRGEPEGGRLGGVHDQADHGLPIHGGGEAVAHRLPGGLGGEVPPPPGGSLLAHHVHDQLAEGRDHLQRDVIRAQQQRRIVRGHAPHP